MTTSSGTAAMNGMDAEGEATAYCVNQESAVPPDAAASEVTEATLPTGEIFAGVRALLVDDVEINRRVAKAFLERYGCDVDLAEHGQAAVDLASGATYDVIFLDCQMPVMDGYEAARQIRALPAYAAVPIVALTAGALQGDVERCVAAGMTDYVSKPFRPLDLAASLDRARRLVGRPGVGQRVPAAPAPFDRESLLETFDGDAAAIRELSDILARDLPTYLEQMKAACGESDWQTVSRIAHKIRGAAGTVLAAGVCSIGQEVETLANEGRDADVAAGVGHLGQSIDELLAALNSWEGRT
jgi:CheY-like chemotaxis protein